jgi:hypothetical protein
MESYRVVRDLNITLIDTDSTAEREKVKKSMTPNAASAQPKHA